MFWVTILKKKKKTGAKAIQKIQASRRTRNVPKIERFAMHLEKIMFDMGQIIVLRDECMRIVVRQSVVVRLFSRQAPSRMASPTRPKTCLM